MSGWGFEPILDSYGIVLALAGLLGVILLLVAPWRQQIGRNRRWILLGLRAAVIGLLLIAMLRPVRWSTQSRPQETSLLVLYDRSRSMSVEDSSGGKSRWAQLASTLRSSSAEWDQLKQGFHIEVFGFADKLDTSITELTFEKLPTAAQGQQTDIAGSLSEALRRLAGKRLVGVILLSDGVQRVLKPRVDVQQVVRELSRTGVPLFTIPFGKPRDQSQARDVAIEKLADHFVVYVKNELDVRAALRVQGYVNQPIPVRAILDGPNPGDKTEFGPTELTATQDDQSLDVQFLLTPEKPGNYRLRVEAPRQAGELVADNNQLTAYLQVLEGGVKVLYVESNLVGPEQQILRQSLSAAPDLELDYRPVDLRLRDQWPIQLERDEPLSKYDIVMIGDVPAEALGINNLNRIATFVEGGKGLMMLGGLNTFGPGGYGRDRFKSFARILPVTMSGLEFQEIGVEQAIRADTHLQGPLKLVPRPHFITQLAATAKASEAAWQSLPPLLGANRFESLPARAVRLIETPTPNSAPVLLAWEFDRGRVLVFAADSTHRWWRYGFPDLHKRFWRQCMLWLANQDEQLRRDVWIRLAKYRYQVGEALAFTAGARDELGNVLKNVQLTAELQRGTEAARELQLTPTGDDWQGPSTDMQQAGSYELRITARLEGREIGKASTRFEVVARDLELSEPAANPEQLVALARITQNAGGRSLPPEQLRDLLRELHQNPPKMIVDIESKWRFGDGLLDTWPFFLAFVGLLGTEWTLRKKWGLN